MLTEINKLMMRKILLLVAFASTTFLVACEKDKKQDTGQEQLQGRDAFIGTYSFTNTYEHVAYVSQDNYDTLRGTKTYNLSIEKPNPDDKGSDAVMIRNFWAEYPGAWTVIARVSPDGKSLQFKSEDNDGEMNMTRFVAPLNADKSIDFDYFRYRLHVANMGYEKGAGKAVRQ